MFLTSVTMATCEVPGCQEACNMNAASQAVAGSFAPEKQPPKAYFIVIGKLALALNRFAAPRKAAVVRGEALPFRGRSACVAVVSLTFAPERGLPAGLYVQLRECLCRGQPGDFPNTDSKCELKVSH